jgi:hypothetical protein
MIFLFLAGMPINLSKFWGLYYNFDCYFLAFHDLEEKKTLYFEAKICELLAL